MNILKNDIFLVSYPKSGNTWLRFILANLLKTDSHDEINFHNAINFIPEVDVHNEQVNSISDDRIFKSHKLFTPIYPKVVYIVRDARDVYVSYYHYLKKELDDSLTFSQFLRKKDLYPSRWCEHVSSWLNQPNIIYILKYEDLLNNTYSEINKLMETLWPNRFSKEQIQKAINLSSFENMQKSEKKFGRPFKSQKAKEKSSIFVRKGIIGDWKNFFTKEDEIFINKEEGNILKHLNYI